MYTCTQARSQDRFGGGGGAAPQKVDFLNLTPPPLTLLQKPHFWSILWLKVGLLLDLGGASHSLHPLAKGLLVLAYN